MSEPMDLFVLNGSAPNQAIALARRGPDIAVSRIDLQHAEIRSFVAFTDRVEQVVLGGPRPTARELDDIGRRLFAHVFNGDVLQLYTRLPDGRVSIQIATDEPDIHRIPWEFLTPSDRGPVPHQERCIVRVVPMCATKRRPLPARPRKKLRLLLIVSDPVDQSIVTWKDVELGVRRAFGECTKNLATLEVVPGASSQVLLQVLNADDGFDVIHFLGHGTEVNGEGRLVLVDVDNAGKSDFITGAQFATALSGQKRLKLVILSACLTGAGNIKDRFGPVATTLLRSGVPAVIANQASIPNRSVAPFVTALYQCLLRDGNIDTAMMAGRVALDFELRKSIPPDKAVVEWGIPALYRLPGGDQLFAARRA